MKNIKLKFLLTFFLTSVLFTSSAQTLKSVYFVDGVAIRHQLNPAFAPQSGYVGIPILGNFGLSINSNMGIETFLYPTKGGEFNTFLHKDINSNKFLDKLNSNNIFDANVSLNIIQTGFYAWGGFNTLDIGVKSLTSTTLPYDLFAFLKNGMSNEAGNTYNLSDIGVNSQNYVDISLGHSRQINDKIRVGVKAKLLLGIANVQTNFDNISLYMSQDKWMIDGKGEINASGIKFETDPANNEITGIGDAEIGMNGLGFAVDLGVTYEPIDNLEVSLAVIDLGFINWENNTKGAMSGEPVIFEGFNDIDMDDTGSFDDQIDDLTNDVEALFTFYEMKGGGKHKQTLNTTLNVGAEYSLSEDRFSVGVLSSTLFREKYIISDVMLSANYTPKRWFTLTGHTSISNIGWTWGGLLTFSPKKFNFFIGTTMVSSKFSPQLAPVGELILNVNFGMSVYLARNKAKK